MFINIFRRLNIQRFTTLDLIVYIGNAGFQGSMYGLGVSSILEICITTAILILGWGSISIFIQLYLGLKPFNGFSLSEDIDQPRY